jgi:hypothetical protein
MSGIRQRAVDSKQATAKFKLCQGVQFHFLEGRFDMRDLGAVLDHEEPCPIRWKIAGNSYWLLLARAPAIFSCPSEPRTHGRWNRANNTKT